MNRFKDHLIAAAVLSVLAIIGTIMNSHQAAAQGPPNGLAVNIVNPLPVPVTGSTTISGTVESTIANTPTTAVPTVAAPAASQLYESSCTGFFNGGSGMICTFAPPPAGHTLFIETASIRSSPTSGQAPVNALIKNTNNGVSGVSIAIPMVQQGGGSFTGTLAGRIWVKAGETPTCSVLQNNNDSGGALCSIIGYLVPAQ
jgi:hypothetical protein